jgi:hypothetical protein
VHHDLDHILESVNTAYFDDAVTARIEWARRPRARRAGAPAPTHILLGRCFIEDGVIRIHPVLANKWVPQYVLTFVVYHECLHTLFTHANQALEGWHPPEFEVAERRCVYRDRAEAWIARNLPRLIRAAAPKSARAQRKPRTRPRNAA